MNKLFEAVPVSEKPPTNRFWCIAIDDKGSLFEAMYHQDKWYQSWDDGKQDDITDITRFWLRPLPPPTKEAEQRAEELYPHIGGAGNYLSSSMTLNDWADAERAAYLKGHQEASTGQAGEVKVLRDALVRLMQAIPNQFNDYDWWPDELSTAFELANEALSSPSHTVEPDKVEEEIKTNNHDLGICKKCKHRPATTDYNGHGHYVCDPCNDSLNRYFEEEYK